MRLKLSVIDVCVIIMIAVVLAALLVPSGNFDLSHRFPPASAKPSLNLTASDGEYTMGSGRGLRSKLSILSDGRYSLIDWGCTGVDRRECGYASQSEGRLVLSPWQTSGREIERSLVLIRWRRRRYLVPPGKMPEFRNAIIEGREPRDELLGTFYLRAPITRTDALPESPEEWAKDLRNTVVVGQILETSTVGLAKASRARVNLGAEQGIRQGDLVTVQRRGDATQRRFRVVSVTDSSCIADECSPGVSDEPPEAGQTVLYEKTEGGSR